MRDLNQVLDALVKQIPEDFEHRKDMVSEFNSVRESIPYTAPEAMSLRWEQCAEILTDYIPKLTTDTDTDTDTTDTTDATDTTDWQNTVAKIFNAKVDFKGYL